MKHEGVKINIRLTGQTLPQDAINAEAARYYNELTTSWHETVRANEENRKNKPEQMELL